LRSATGVEQTVVFGAALHVSGRDQGRLQRTLEQLAAAHPALRMEPIATTLEHAFIYLMSHGAHNGAPQ
jgi:ABC-2 type transport system ATP-binding protein